MRLFQSLADFLADLEGGSGVEYAILISGIAAVIFAAVTAFGAAVLKLFTDANTKLPFF